MPDDKQRQIRYAEGAKEFRGLMGMADRLPDRFKKIRKNTSAQYANYCNKMATLCETGGTKGLIPSEREHMLMLMDEGKAMNTLAKRALILDRISQWTMGV
ncbi:MAG: hypothetical protein PHS02_03130, partial [Candidatus ainarchaeum sp.]|nr:hypothetical protein [Candidatus ainarchaeum sp.]